jgi:signal transduction histidine kinase
MEPETTNLGSAIICDPHGCMLQILRDDLNLCVNLPAGRFFAAVVDPENRDKANLFIEAIQREKAVFDWEMNACTNSVVRSLYFAGGIHDDRMLVLVAQTRAGIAKLYEEFAKINNEQVNHLRLVAKELAENQRQAIARDTQFFVELTRLNNELATLQRELMKKNADLERLGALKNQFLGIAAHDLRSPLGVILSYSEFLETEAGPSLSREHLDFLNVIKRTSNYMLTLVNDLLDLSAIESGKLTLDLQPADIVALIDHNAALNRILAAKKNIRLDFIPPQQPLRVFVDSGKMGQVLNNLIGNAVKFSHAGTTVTVGLEARESDIVVSVADQGQGIAPSEISRLFVPFQRTSTRSTSGEHCTGLGLAIVHKIVTGHGGRVWVESEKGKGSVFHFSLPVTMP